VLTGNDTITRRKLHFHQKPARYTFTSRRVPSKADSRSLWLKDSQKIRLTEPELANAVDGVGVGLPLASPANPFYDTREF